MHINTQDVFMCTCMCAFVCAQTCSGGFVSKKKSKLAEVCASRVFCGNSLLQGSVLAIVFFLRLEKHLAWFKSSCLFCIGLETSLKKKGHYHHCDIVSGVYLHAYIDKNSHIHIYSSEARIFLCNLRTIIYSVRMHLRKGTPYIDSV